MIQGSHRRFYRLIGFFPLFLLLLGSCVTQRKIVVDLYHPPELNLADDLDTVTAIHRISADDRAFLEEGRKSFGGMQDEGVRVLAGERAMVALFEHLFNSDDYVISGNIEWLDTLTLHGDTQPPPFSKRMLDKVAETQNSDLLISLESVKYQAEVQYSTYDRRTRESQNKIWSKTVLYNVQYEIMQQADFIFTVETFWRIYNLTNGKIINQYHVRDSIEYQVDGKTREEVNKKLPSYQSAAERAGYITGEQFARIILPSYRTVLRFYYGGGNRDLRQATRFVRFRKWTEASRMWKDMLEEARPGLKSKLWYNLALVSEMNGRPGEALTFLTRAYQWHADPQILHYRNTILNTWGQTIN